MTIKIHFNFTGKAILDDHQKNVQFSSAADFKAANYNSKPAPKMIESKQYIYEEMSLYFEGTFFFLNYFFIYLTIDTVFHPSGFFSKWHGNFFKISCLKMV